MRRYFHNELNEIYELKPWFMVMGRMLLIVFGVIVSGICFSQVADDFSDGEIHTNPVWSGDTSLYWVVDPVSSGGGSLAPGANDDGKVLCSKPDQNDAVITTTSDISEGEWVFSVADGAGWSLSGTNNYNIILMSDENDVSKLKDGNFDFNGYYMHRGCSGSDDVFELYRQDGTTSTMILNTYYPASPDGSGAETGHTLRIVRDNGTWEIFIDEGFDTIPVTQRGGSILDTTHSISLYFGISTNISNASNMRVLYFDNLSIQSTGGNLLPPTGLSIKYIAPDKINISWTKPGGTFGIDWDGMLMFAREGSPNDANLSNSDAVDYTGNLVYGGGTQSNNSFCVVNQNTDSNGDVIVTGLDGGKSYYFVAYAFKEVAGDDNDDWSMASLEVDDVSLVHGVSDFCAFAGEASALLQWDNYTAVHGVWWDEVMIVGKHGDVVDQSPLGNGLNYFANQSFGQGTELGGPGTGNYVVYKGIEDSVIVSDLIDDSIYFFRAFVRYDTLWTGAGEYRDTSVIPSSETILISEIADPTDNLYARFVEIYNSGNSIVDLSTESWYLCKQTNGGSWSDISLSGKIYPECTYVISYNTSDFVNTYFFQPDQSSTSINGNGDDGYFLYKGGDHLNGKLVDSYGIIDQDGSGTLWEYTDSRVIRKDTVTSARKYWNNSDWIISNSSTTTDMEPGRHKSTICWQGSVSGDWNDGANWTGGDIPDTVTSVIIPGGTSSIPEITGSALCYKLKIQASGRLNLKSSGNLKIKTDFIIKSDSSGTGSIITEGVNNFHCTGEVKIEKYFSFNNRWHYFSPPLKGCNAAIFAGCYLNVWDEPLQLWEHIVNSNDSLEITKGYSVNLPDIVGNRAIFSSTGGVINTGTYYTETLTNTSGQDSSLNGFNLIGNPYPSSIDWDLVNIPPNLDAAIYYWDPSAGVQGMYRSYVPGVGGSGSRYVPPMHGFFIHSNDILIGTKLSFNNSVRVHDGQNIQYKNGSFNEILRFIVCGNGFCDETYLNFLPQATDGFDAAYDAYKLFTPDTVIPQIYSRISNADLSVNSMPLDKKGVIVPLGFKSEIDGIYTLRLNQFTAFNPYNSIVLKDLLTGSTQNLYKQGSYTFSHSAGNNSNRFLLLINYSFIDKPSIHNPVDISISFTDNIIRINNEGYENLTIEVLNILGQRIKDLKLTKINKNTFRLPDISGFYLIKVRLDDGIYVKKVFIP